MKAILRTIFCGVMGATLLVSLGAQLACAQAPPGPQGGSQGTGAPQTPPQQPATT